jgi:hypothetical protein
MDLVLSRTQNYPIVTMARFQNIMERLWIVRVGQEEEK